MFEYTLKICLVFQIISTVKPATDRESFSQVASSTEDEERKNGHIQHLNAAADENEQLNGDDGENEQISDEAPDVKVQKLKEQDTPKSHKRREKKTSWKFKNAVNNKKDEAGFDLTPEEMKKFKIWKDGVIPYYIDVVSFSDKVLRDKIRNFLEMVNSVTNINFVELRGPPSNDNERWVFFMNRRGLLGCADHSIKNFTNQGVQHVVLGYDCIATRGEIAEAVMSIAGVPAQHNAPDRDKYIQVNMDNIVPDKKYLFEKLNDNEWLFHDLAYDYDSVTHYDMHKYSANGHATIQLKKISEDLNPTTVFSTIDLQKIKMLYNFITKNKKVQTSVCEKLFQIGNEFIAGPSKSIPLNPRKKPSRYTGTHSNGADESKEKIEGEDLNEPSGNNNKNDKYREMDDNNKNENIDNNENDDNNDDNNENDDDNKINNNDNNNDNEDNSKANKNEKNKGEKEINGRDNDEKRADNGERLDKDGNNENKRDETVENEKNIEADNSILKLNGVIPLKGRGTVKKREKAKHFVDLLQELSDYNSDIDFRRETLN